MRISHVENRLEQQLTLRDFIVNSVDNLTKVGSSCITSQRVHARLSALKENWEKFSLVHDAINLSITKLAPDDRTQIKTHVYFSDNLFAATYDSYLEAVEKMNSLLDPDSESNTDVPSAPHSSSIPVYFHHARLPRIDIPKFNGTPSDWLSFKDLFSSLILANPTLSAVEKLQYLKTSLVGPASHLLKNTTLTSENFQKAWEALIAFYENKRLLVNSALHSLLTLKRMTKESASEMEQLYTNIMQIHRTLETLKRPIQHWDDFFVFIAVQRLDAESVKAWEHFLGSSKEPPTWTQFSDFLITRLLSLQAFEKSRTGKPSTSSNQSSFKLHFQGKSKNTHSQKPSLCTLCSSSHYITSCPQYNAKSVPQRKEILKKYNLCFNCLGSHRVSACRITKRCLKCGQKHHTTIHQKEAAKSTISDSTSTTNPAETDTHVLQVSCRDQPINSGVLLATAQVLAISSSGETVKVRALIDQGSEISLVTERLVQMLHLSRMSSSIPLTGIGAQQSNTTKGLTHFTIRSHTGNFEVNITAYILPKLTSSLPSTDFKQNHWPHLDGLPLADYNYKSPGAIDIILGSDVFHQIIEPGLIKGDENSPMAQSTKFGWIISGPVANHSPSELHGYHVMVDKELHDALQLFWRVDEIPMASSPSLTKEDQECEQYFKSTYSRDDQGRYTVRLPFKKSIDLLGESRTKAMRMLYRLSHKFSTNQNYAQAYYEFLQTYESLGHMVQVPPSQPEPKSTYYLPHHGVFRENSSTTKLRVVFNGSSLTNSGISLNDLLHTGTKLQTDIFEVLIWFRQFRYVFSCDIEKMYRQINVHPGDWNYQRILWMNQDHEVSTYQLTTVTYGLACAPFLALRTIAQLVEDDGERFPLAIPPLTQGRYVDDIFGGADSVEQTRDILQQLISLCMAGGFPLQKWTSNDTGIFKSISLNSNENPTSIKFEESTTVSILGLRWNSTTDSFQFTTDLVQPSGTTKRIILSTIAKIFDPLGFLAPIIITAKILIQELWSIKLGWDDPLPSPVVNRWTRFLETLQDITKLTFPRWINLKQNQDVEIHGFCDASQLALCAAVYIRAKQADKYYTHLICAKTKVAPLKKMTIPRLELTAATLLTKLMSKLLNILKLERTPIVMWTDSAIVLTWINNHPSRWKEFVHNRVCLIHETLPQAVWKFTPGIENPADYGTRGLTPAQLIQQTSWWSGPPWLSKEATAWPTGPALNQLENLEEKPVQIFVNNCPTTNLWNLISKYSNLNRLLRITVLCRRAISRFKGNRTNLLNQPITPQELENAKLYWVKEIQKRAFPHEIKLISNQQQLPRSNPLLHLTPWIDSQGLLRVGGRLQSAPLSTTSKHPLILPRNSVLTSLVISDAHIKTLHGGTQLTLSLIRNEFWIIGGRAPVRSFILKCIRCARYRQKRAHQIMGQLPAERVTPSRPFLHSGIDYAGPIVLKSWKGRNSRTYKGYIALFVCLSTSAIHIELVTDYSTEAFIAAYKRFVSRRGICTTLTSDCGTNLKGADNELQRMFLSSSKELDRLSSLLSKDGTLWKFIPPATPHFGGKWEAGVKSVKYHLKRVIGNQVLTYEEMTTFLTQVEAVLNSRPLCALTDDPDDLAVLTPAHFLIGSSLATVPEPSLEHLKTSHLSRWQLSRQMLDSFWKLWSKGYLQRYLSMYKWNNPSPSLQEGTLVLVSDERYPPSKWPLGRIIKTHPGKDGRVRVVTVRTQNTTLTRPVVKLCPLPNSQ